MSLAVKGRYLNIQCQIVGIRRISTSATDMVLTLACGHEQPIEFRGGLRLIFDEMSYHTCRDCEDDAVRLLPPISYEGELRTLEDGR